MQLLTSYERSIYNMQKKLELKIFNMKKIVKISLKNLFRLFIWLPKSSL